MAAVVISAYVISTLFISDNTKNRFLKCVKNFSSIALAAELGFLLYYICSLRVRINYFWWKYIAVAVLTGVAANLFEKFIEPRSLSRFKQFIEKIGGCVLSLFLALIVFAILSWLFNFSISIVVTEILFELCCVACLFGTESESRCGK
jgi:hypothetical protein